MQTLQPTLSLPSGVTVNSVTIYKRGVLCTIKFNNYSSTLTTRTKIGTLPAGCRPPSQLNVFGVEHNGSSATYRHSYVLLDPNGDIKTDGPFNGIYMDLTYLCV